MSEFVSSSGWKLQLEDAFPWARGEPTSSLCSLLVVSPFELIHREEPLRRTAFASKSEALGAHLCTSPSTSASILR